MTTGFLISIIDRELLQSLYISVDPQMCCRENMFVFVENARDKFKQWPDFC